MNLNPETERRLQQLKARYQQSLPQKAADIEQAKQDFDTGADPEGETLYRLTHNLAGSAEPYGFAKISCLSAAVTQLFKNGAVQQQAHAEVIKAVDLLLIEMKSGS